MFACRKNGEREKYKKVPRVRCSHIDFGSEDEEPH